ncbi:hypothetical protein MJ579_17615 [Klebsiella pneumoniae]|nr:hypothetical protein MJ579_17615 [Klebsiella pneumoniae]
MSAAASISSPTWSGLEDEHVSYNAGYTNVHELIGVAHAVRTSVAVSRITSGCATSAKACWSIGRRLTARSVKAVMGEKSNAATRRRRAELPDPAPEMGYPLDLQR